MTEYSMPLSDAEVRAVLGWRKTQHRVVLGPSRPSYSVGDQLWIQEAWADVNIDNRPALLYRADHQYDFLENDDLVVQDPGWRDAIDMPRLASRVSLDITDIRMQRLQDITWPDAVYEGMAPPENCFSLGPGTERPRDEFRRFWSSIHGADAWDANPLVAALSFRTVRAKTFVEIWERKGRWIAGRGLLTDIVLFLRQQCLVPKRDPNDPCRVNFTLLLPEVTDAFTGERTSVISLIPAELRNIFVERCGRILTRHAVVAERAISRIKSKEISKMTLRIMSSFLAIHERELAQSGEAQLWQVAAEEFGLKWHALPEPAGLVRRM